jgi:hypothetical protein
MANLFFLPALLLSVAAGLLPPVSAGPSSAAAHPSSATPSAASPSRTGAGDDPFRAYQWGV